MTNIIKRLLVLLLVAGSVYGISQTGAWFTDQEVLGESSVDTGTIDLEIDQSQERTYKLEDLKPSQNGYINVVVQNVGTNPLNLFKTLKDFETSDLLVSEPECEAEGGEWTIEYDANGRYVSGTCEGERPNEVHNLDDKINYDLRVELYPTHPDDEESKYVWWETIYLDSDNVKLSNIKNVYLGMIPAGWYMKVMQSYHLPGEEVGNRYQGDMMTFDMVFDAEQLGKSKLVLENKYESNGDLSHHLWNDGISATLGYTVRDRSFDYDLTTEGISGAYTLIAWEDEDHEWIWEERDEAIVIAHISDITNPVVDSIDLNRDLTNAKVWLVPGTQGTVGGSAGLFPWNATETLFETGLMDYYDSDL